MRPLKLSWTAQALIVLGLLLVGLIILLTFERPPVRTEQIGFRGVAMEQLQNPRTARQVAARNVVPAAPEAADTDGDKARDIYENVQVLGELSAAQFGRLMVAMTEWIVPQHIRDNPDSANGCAYCHNVQNMASDEVYTKGVTRRMLQMTRTINADWGNHVAQTGVTCYTCHRGQPVPAYAWGRLEGIDNRAGLAGPTGQNRPTAAINYSSLPFDPFTPFLLRDDDIRNITPRTWLPGNNADDVRIAEWTYSLMVHMSQGLGVNCTFCHNSRAFGSWEQSPPQRLTAWHGIRMARAVNNEYVEPLTPLWVRNPRGPADFQTSHARLGPQGDALKVNCATCHQGVNRPLLGAPMLRDYPELNLVGRGPLRTSEATAPAGASRN
ncbi:photosynthetic reaction center cytochrome PufC [Falsiroseomonas oryziterrae]|uniref:photosynthetic reaction center cytochrome PufC n=1 Tax=Falsiroseomonas oryziterrae TaxID=2911368 RepID=UPI001EED9E0D|nr:photosynthetic reaction center cytochrome PufC [Roseomonas sp. NPKOSM-4]